MSHADALAMLAQARYEAIWPDMIQEGDELAFPPPRMMFWMGAPSPATKFVRAELVSTMKASDGQPYVRLVGRYDDGRSEHIVLSQADAVYRKAG